MSYGTYVTNAGSYNLSGSDGEKKWGEKIREAIPYALGFSFIAGVKEILLPNMRFYDYSDEDIPKDQIWMNNIKNYLFMGVYDTANFGYFYGSHV